MSKVTEYLKNKLSNTGTRAKSAAQNAVYVPYKALQYADAKKNYFEKLAAGADPQKISAEIARFLMAQPEEWTRLGLDWLARWQERKVSDKFFKLEDEIQEALTKHLADKQVKHLGGKYPAEVAGSQSRIAFTYGKPWRGRVPTKYKAIEDRKYDSSKTIFDPLEYKIAAEERDIRTKGRKVTSRKLQEKRKKELEILMSQLVGQAMTGPNQSKAYNEAIKNILKFRD